MRECRGRRGRASALALWRIVVVLDGHQRGMRSTYLTAAASASLLVRCPRSRGDAIARAVSDASPASRSRDSAKSVSSTPALIQVASLPTVLRWRGESARFSSTPSTPSPSKPRRPMIQSTRRWRPGTVAPIRSSPRQDAPPRAAQGEARPRARTLGLLAQLLEVRPRRVFGQRAWCRSGSPGARRTARPCAKTALLRQD